jgi:hypothetical protein
VSPGSSDGLPGERLPSPLGAPTDPLRPTGRAGETGAAPGPRRSGAGKVLVVLALALVGIPILLWIVFLLLASLAF